MMPAAVRKSKGLRRVVSPATSPRRSPRRWTVPALPIAQGSKPPCREFRDIIDRLELNGVVRLIAQHFEALVIAHDSKTSSALSSSVAARCREPRQEAPATRCTAASLRDNRQPDHE